MIHYDTCPVCKSSDIIHYLFAKDYTVSGEEFAIWKCNKCDLKFTQDIPDQDSIAPYYKADSYISHTETREGLVNRLYHFVRNKTLQSKYELVVKSTGLRKGNILDIGCGTGAFLEVMKNRGWDVIGLEPDPAARQKAFDVHGIKAWPSAEIYDLASNQFDAITMWHVLEHVHALDDYMHHLKRMIRAKGRIFIAVPNHESYDAKHYEKHWAAWDVPRHLYHFSPSSMKILLMRHGLELISERPMWYDSVYVSMLSEQYKNGKPNLFGAVISGMMSNLKAAFNTESCSSIIYEIRKP